MAKNDLESMSRDELLELRKKVDKAIESFDARMRKEALAAAEAEAAKRGYQLTELLGSAKAKGGKKKAVQNPPKYQHAEDPTLTWTGRGRQPAWIKEHLAAGKSLDDLLIK